MSKHLYPRLTSRMLKQRWAERLADSLALPPQQRRALTSACRYAIRHRLTTGAVDRLLLQDGVSDGARIVDVISDFVDGPRPGVGSTAAAMRFVEDRHGADNPIVRLLRSEIRSGAGAKTAPSIVAALEILL